MSAMDEIQEGMRAVKFGLRLLAEFGSELAAAAIAYKMVDVVDGIVGGDFDRAAQDVWGSAATIQSVICGAMVDMVKSDVDDRTMSVYVSGVELIRGGKYKAAYQQLVEAGRRLADRIGIGDVFLVAQSGSGLVGNQTPDSSERAN